MAQTAYLANKAEHKAGTVSIRVAGVSARDRHRRTQHGHQEENLPQRDRGHWQLGRSGFAQGLAWRVACLAVRAVERAIPGARARPHVEDALVGARAEACPASEDTAGMEGNEERDGSASHTATFYGFYNYLVWPARGAVWRGHGPRRTSSTAPPGSAF